MEMVPINFIKEGDILASNIYNYNGDLLVFKETKINKKILERLKCWNHTILPIKRSPLTECTTKIIEITTKNKALYAINNIFNIFHEYIDDTCEAITEEIKERTKEKINELQNITHEIVNNIINKRHVMLNLENIKKSDNYTFEHSINTATIALVLGIGYGLNKEQLYDLTLGTMLHDIGKVFIPRKILNKKGKLNEEEFEVIKGHTVKGFNLLKSSTNLKEAAISISLNHHERVDGNGYPKALKGDEIDILSRLAAIADVYDALVSDRPYREGLSPSEAVEFILASGEKHFSIDIVKVFVERVIPFPINSVVKLSNNSIGIVESLNPKFPLRPIVKIIRENRESVKPYLCNLLNNRTIVIEDII